jgi:hypothetical protein
VNSSLLDVLRSEAEREIADAEANHRDVEAAKAVLRHARGVVHGRSNSPAEAPGVNALKLVGARRPGLLAVRTTSAVLSVGFNAPPAARLVGLYILADLLPLISLGYRTMSIWSILRLLASVEPCRRPTEQLQPLLDEVVDQIDGARARLGELVRETATAHARRQSLS